jgi:hypothetical protein
VRPDQALVVVALKLGKGNRKASAFTADQDEHLVLALLVRGHPDDLDLVTHAQRRDAAPGGDTPGHNGKRSRSSREEYHPTVCSWGV